MTQYKLVPIIPTEEMIAKGGHVNSEWLNDSAPLGEKRYQLPINGIWQTMLEASPSIPKSQSLLSDTELRDLFHAHCPNDEVLMDEIYAMCRAVESKVRQQDEEMRRDAERYSWLRSDDIEIPDGQREINVYMERLPFREDQNDEFLIEHELDAAIDAAIAKQKGNHHG